MPILLRPRHDLCLAFALCAVATTSAPAAPNRHDVGPQTMVCESYENALNHCTADTSKGMMLVVQYSTIACVQGKTWGYDSRGVWVDKGCRAEFRAGLGDATHSRHASNPPTGRALIPGVDFRPEEDVYPADTRRPNAVRRTTIYCASENGLFMQCPIDVPNSVRLTRQESRTRCVEDQNWGWDEQGVWVNQGCRAQFVVD